jgi:isoquinoline 1-oxidoreductase beta subunit
LKSGAFPADIGPTRRSVLGGGMALVLGLALPGRARGAAAEPAGAQLAPNAFVRIGEDDLVTIIIKHIEFGQGAATGLATIVADELDADWEQVRIEFATNNDALYKNLLFGTMSTSGSSSMANSWMQMRMAGATARSLLVSAAAQRWGVAAGTIAVSRGIVSAPGRSARFGELVAVAASLVPPDQPRLKTPEQFTLIGKEGPRVDSRAKSDGSARFTMDMILPGMVHAVVLHPPAFGGKVGRVDDAAALAMPGVLAVRQVPQGVAVFARSFYEAMRGRSALAVEWDLGSAETRSSEQVFAAAEALAQAAGKIVEQAGDIEAGLAAAPHRLEATYRLPYLAHAPMEPLDAVIRAKDGRLDVWMGSQMQVFETSAIAETLGIAPDRAVLHECYAGGSFGRRATMGMDFGREAGQVCKAWGGPEPVKFAWTREDDIMGGFYRPQMVHRLRGAIDADGRITAWDQVVAGQSFVFGSPFAASAEKLGYDSAMIEGSSELGYRFGAHRLGVRVLPCGVPTSFWRSVGFSHNSYVVETFLDELLALGGRDAVQGRLALIDDPRMCAVIERAAAISGYGRRLPEGRALGVACVKSFKTYTAQVVEVSCGADGLPVVHKVWCAVDCGIAINPGVIRAQIEGGIGFALGHALYAEIEIGEGGIVQQRNFDRYRSLRMGEMPDIEVAIIASSVEPSGIGEPGVPPLGPALANAWRRLTGYRVRRLPFARRAWDQA